MIGAFVRPRPVTAPARGRDAVAMQARSVTLRRGTKTVVREVDLSVRAGEIFALVGANGAGKSTLLQALAGDLEPADGQVTLFDRPLRQWPAAEAALRRAVLPQQNVVSFPFRAREVVAMGRVPWQRLPEAALDDEAIDDAMARTDTSELAERRFTSLSGGEAQRVSLARVLAQRAPVLLLDEPTSALDPHHQESVFALLRSRADDGDAVVVVVHDLNLAAAYAGHVAVLAGGSVLADGRADEVLTDDILSAAYQHPIEVIRHPRSGLPVIGPRR